MIAALVAWSARHPWPVLVAGLLFAVAGAFGASLLARDVVPDLSEPQIAVVATWMGRPAAQVEERVTQPLTRALAGARGSTSARAVSMSGMAYVDVVFDAGADLDAARMDVDARVASLRGGLPPGARVEVGPAASSTSWVFQYALVDRSGRQSPLALRRLQDDVVRPALAALPGVAEVASLGGGAQQVRVEVKEGPLEAKGLAFSDVASAVRSALDAPGVTFDTLRTVPVAAPASAGRPAPACALEDVASVRVDEDMPEGVADLGGQWEAVGGVVLARPDADPVSLVARVQRALADVRARLPSSVEATVVYDRTGLAGRAHDTLARALAEEVAAATLVILVFLLHARSALVPLVTLPVVLLLTFGGMALLGVPATIMSLGGIGIALGIAVDADVVALEACHRAMQALGAATTERRRRETLAAAAASLAPAVTTALVMTAIAFLPVLAFSGETGRLLRPLAAAKTLVVLAAAGVSLTVGPALRDRLVVGRVTPEFGNPLTRALVSLYRPFVHFALARPALTLATAALAAASCLPIAAHLGGEFLPSIDEGDLLFMPSTLPGVRPERAASQLRKQDRAMAAFPEVASVFGKVGRAESATDPAPFAMAETVVRLKPRAEWPEVPVARWYSRWAPPGVRRVLGWIWPEHERETTAALVEALDRATRRPGWTSAWTAPARARMQMMSTGVRTPIGVRVAASDPGRLAALGPALRSLAERVEGTRSAVFESLGGEPRLRFAPDAAAMAAHDVDPALVESTADLVVSGGLVGELAHGGRSLRVRLAPDATGLRGPADDLRDATVRSRGGAGQPVALALLGRAAYEEAPAAIRTENGERVAYVYVDLEPGVDPVGWVERAQREVDAAARTLALRPGERIEWAGQYRLFAAGARRFAWIASAACLALLALLAVQFRSLTEALIVAVAVPFALVGSVWTLFLLGYPLSAPVWVGLLSVVGLATQTGVVMVLYVDESFYARVRDGRLQTREDVVAAHADGTVQRLRPKVMTITTLAAALVPLLWSEGAGAEIMKRVAAPMVGGVVTSAFLTLEVLPVLYTLWRCRQLALAKRRGVPIAAITGTAPSWARGHRADS